MPHLRVIDAIGRTHVSPYSDVLHEVAFELWAGDCARDASRVARVLSTDDVWRQTAGLVEDDPGPSVDTIARWVRVEDWDRKYIALIQEALPHTVAAAAVTLVNAAKPAAEELARLIATGEKLSMSDRIKADACKYVLTTVLGENVASVARPVVDRAIDIQDLSKMSLEELAEVERQLLGG
jgi:hypothetical protein